MAFRRTRRAYRPRRAGRRMMRRKSKMARIKRDIMKCNFPTKIKFMGLPEKKVMFISQVFTYNSKSKVIKLNPFDCPNIVSLFHKKGDIVVPNFDKMMVLAVYVKMTPNRNMWDGSASNALAPIDCYYSINNVKNENNYEAVAKTYKQNFTFNANENFTIYIGKPSTIQTVSGVIYKPGTWWSLGEYKIPELKDERVGEYRRDSEEEEDDMEEDIVCESNVDTTDKLNMNCGRLAFSSGKEPNYTITVSYKIALKG